MMRDAILGAAMAVSAIVPSAASAATPVAAAAAIPVPPVQPGAPPVATPIQPGHWGADGWHPGTPAPTSAATAPALDAPVAPAPAFAAASMPPVPHPYRPYRPVAPGQRLKGVWLDPVLEVQDWREWRLPRPGPGMRWIRYYDDAVLLDVDDRVVTAYGAMGWDRPRRPYPPRDMQARGWEGRPRPPMASVLVSHPTPGTTVTTRQVWPQLGYDGGFDGRSGYGVAPMAVVNVVPGTVTTVTTTRIERVPGAIRRARPASRRSKLLHR